MADCGNITVTLQDLQKLKKKCSSAKKGEVFKFKGQDVLKEYGDYLIEYLEQQIGN